MNGKIETSGQHRSAGASILPSKLRPACAGWAARVARGGCAVAPCAVAIAHVTAS